MEFIQHMRGSGCKTDSQQVNRQTSQTHTGGLGEEGGRQHVLRFCLPRFRRCTQVQRDEDDKGHRCQQSEEVIDALSNVLWFCAVEWAKTRLEVFK